MRNYKMVYDPKRGHAVTERVLIAEEALGRRLPIGVETFVYEGQLVICEDRAYNRLLHARVKALKESGDANKRHCYVCGRYDDVANLYVNEKNKYSRYHQACHSAYCREKYPSLNPRTPGVCKRGHEMEGLHKNGKKFCVVCRDMRWKKWIDENPRESKLKFCAQGHRIRVEGYCKRCHEAKYKEWKQKYDIK